MRGNSKIEIWDNLKTSAKATFASLKRSISSINPFLIKLATLIKGGGRKKEDIHKYQHQ